MPPKPLPKDFWWGAAISAHQSEGNNINSDSWLNENVKPTIYREPSGDACDSYHRYEEDFALAAGFGFNCHRLGIEWSRIEPEPGRFSVAELDHYERVLEACQRHGLAPIVTFNHFTVPRWFAARGGFEVADGADLFARFAEKATARLGSLIAAALPFNESNIVRLLQWMPSMKRARPLCEATLAACAKATGSAHFSSIMLGDADRIEPVMFDAHAKAVEAIKAGPGNFPVGISLSIQDEQGVGENNRAAEKQRAIYGRWLEPNVAGDFIGVQTYTRVLVGETGNLRPPEDAERTDAGYEFYPAALGNTIRYAAKASGKPIYVTESGIATNDDARRIAFIDQGLAEVRACLDEGIDVRSYIHWSLLDNFEWFAGYRQKFGLVSVDPATFSRTPKPSALHLGALARRNSI
ncbi:MAG TPA: family 1 glycosylhydrolase [Rhizomicrobium sp.]|nr:family 1 glycosylhydrolase [Rhizomicrobium sp.]